MLVWFQLIAKVGLWMVGAERFLIWCRVLIFVSHSGGAFRWALQGRGSFKQGQRPRRDSQVVSFLRANLAKSPHPT